MDLQTGQVTKLHTTVQNYLQGDNTTYKGTNLYNRIQNSMGTRFQNFINGYKTSYHNVTARTCKIIWNAYVHMYMCLNRDFFSWPNLKRDCTQDWLLFFWGRFARQKIAEDLIGSVFRQKKFFWVMFPSSRTKGFLFRVGSYLSDWGLIQGCQIFLGTTYQNGKIYQMTIIYTKWLQHISKGRKKEQMAIKCARIFY
jgi:hypothetical protein